ncbi:MAG TPA: branched-chain amino acid ABC transporter substrate-binding protein [Ktedonobacteraceae bacterium]|nr:branched-chain amino acid ABC transporter substrate-binding protein [Ktedonobacteraceae bacterium]
MKRRWSRIFSLALGIPLMLAILAACGSGTTGTGGNTPTAGSTTIKIATELPVSGKDESSGKPTENGAHLAVDQANANHTIPGYTLVFDPKDDVGPSGTNDPVVGAANIRALIGDALVSAVVGPFNSAVAKSEMPISNLAPLAQISPANTNTCLTQEGAAVGCSGATDLVPTLRPSGKVTYFRIATTDSHQGPAGADYLYKTKGYHSVYIIDDTTTYGVGIADAFSKEWTTDGGTVLGRSSEPPTTTSYVSLLTQIASKHPSVIYFGGLDSTGGILIRQQMEQVPALANLPFGGGDGLVTSTFSKTIGTSGGGPIFGTVATIDVASAPGSQAFLSAYDSTYGVSNLGAYSAAGYDCANIIIQAIKAALAGGAKTPTSSSDAAGAKLFRQAVINAIQNIQFTGVLGPQAFDANGDTTNRVITVYQVGPNPSGIPFSTPGWNPVAAVKIGS